MRVEFSGPLCREAYVYLRACLVKHMEIAPGYVMHYERALLAMGDMPTAPTGMYCPEAPPVAVVCRADQLSFWRAFSMTVARMGVLRPCYLDSRADVAYQWVASMAVEKERPRLHA